MTNEEISRFTFPQTFICGTCKADMDIVDVGVTVAGQVAITTYCEPCDRAISVYMDYDAMLMATHLDLMEKMRRNEIQPS